MPTVCRIPPGAKLLFALMTITANTPYVLAAGKSAFVLSAAFSAQKSDDGHKTKSTKTITADNIANTYSETSSDTTSSGATSSLLYTARFGLDYLFEGGWLLGLHGSFSALDSGDDSSSAVAGTSTYLRAGTSLGVGPAIGYMFDSGLSINAAYLAYNIAGALAKTTSVNGSTTTTVEHKEYAKGSAISVDVAYQFKYGSSFAIGPQISYVAETYSSREDSDDTTVADTSDSSKNSNSTVKNTVTGTFTSTNLVPMVCLSFRI